MAYFCLRPRSIALSPRVISSPRSSRGSSHVTQAIASLPYSSVNRGPRLQRRTVATQQPNNDFSIAILDDYLSLSAPHFAHLSTSVAHIATFTEPIAPGDLAARLRPFSAISTMRERTAFPSSLLRALPNLKLLLCTGTQFETFDLQAAKELGIVVSTAPGRGRTDAAGAGSRQPHGGQDIKKGGSHPATHHTWAMLLALARNVAADDVVVKSGGWQSDVAIGLTGKTIGIVGLGRLGAAVARIAVLAFGMRVVAWSESITQERADRTAAELGLDVETGERESRSKTFRAVSKEELFATADVVSVHYVLSERSRGIVGPAELALMKKDALLVNTSRGPLVDEQALLATVQQGHIRGVALDVFATEPLPLDSPWRRPDWGQAGTSRVLVTPHMGYVEKGIMNAWYAETAENVERWLEGKEVLHRLV